MTSSDSFGGAPSRHLPAPTWRLGQILDGAADSAPDATAFVTGKSRLRVTYRDLQRTVAEHCDALERSGVGAGDVVALRAANSLEFVVALLAATRAGAVVAPLDPALPTAQRLLRLHMVGARLTLTDAPGAAPVSRSGTSQSVLKTMNGAAPSVRLFARPARTIAAAVPGLTERDALIMFTSGTTGRPKMVPWTHENIAAAVTGVSRAYNLGPTDSTVAVMPLFHGHGLIATLLATLSTGGRLVLPAKGRFSAHTFWDDAAAADATWYTAVPTVHQILLETLAAEPKSDLRPRLRFIRSCSAPLSSATATQIEAAFDAPVVPAYGMTEATHQASSALPSDDAATRSSTVGVPTGVSARIVDGNGRSCPAGTAGEIWLRGPTVVRGYLNDAAATAAGFADGWVRTGDLGTLDRGGTLRVTGRIKELINRGGEKISPEHVEDVLASHPGVARAAVFGVPDPLYGEQVAAVIVRCNGSHPDASDVIAFSRDKLAPFEIPAHVSFAEELPLTAKGAINRAELAQFAGTSTPERKDRM